MKPSMRKNFTSFLLLFFALCASLYASSQSYSQNVRHHVILSVDNAGCNSWNTSSEVVEALGKAILKEKLVDGEYPLFSDNDYLSFVGFALDAFSEIDQFVRHKHPIYDSSFSRIMLNKYLRQDYPDSANNVNIGKYPFSLVSIAKPYTLKALKNSNVKVNRTFIVQVTDHHYNGGDFYDELNSLNEKRRNAENPDGKKIDIQSLNLEKILKDSYNVEQNYFFRWIKTYSIMHNNKRTPKGYVEVYEAVPLQKNFTLPAAVDYPERVTAQRLRSGDYVVKIPVRPRENNGYEVQKIEFTLGDEVKTIQGNHSDTVVFNLAKNNSARSISVRAWIRLVDGFYNATVMSPEPEAPLELGRDGLNRTIQIEREGNAQILFFSLPTWLWPKFIESQYEAAAVMTALLIVALVILVVLFLIWFVRHKVFFTPDVDRFKIVRKKK